MPYWHCTDCHHEWEGSKKQDACDWCGYLGYVLEEHTPLAMFIRELPEFLLGILDSENEGRQS